MSGGSGSRCEGRYSKYIELFEFHNDVVTDYTTISLFVVMTVVKSL